MRKKKMVRYSKYGYLFSIPFVLAFILFALYPTFNTLILGFTDSKGAGTTEWNFLTEVGKPWYQNYLDVFTSASFKKAFINTCVLWLISAVPEYTLAMLFAAWYTDRKLKIKAKGLFKTLYYMPNIIAGVTMAMLFASLFGYPKGAVNDICNLFAEFFGIERENYDFFSHEWSVKLIIIAVNIYMYFGSTMILIIAGILGIGTEVFEAAEIDGCNRLQTFFKITLPCMREVMTYLIVVSILGGLNLFDVPAMLIGARCNNAGLTMLMYIRNQAFAGSYLYNRASAASVVLTCLCLIPAAIVFHMRRDKDEALIKKLKRKQRWEELRTKR
jgi:multiple sugar transport system permease protein